MRTAFLILSHQAKAAYRSPIFRQKLIGAIVIGVTSGYIGAVSFTLGAFGDLILQHIGPGQSTITTFKSILLYYFLIDYFLRFLMQKMPVLFIQPYLHLPIKKHVLINYLLVNATGNIFNLIPLLLFSPFILEVIAPQVGMGATMVLLSSLLLLALLNNYLVLYAKQLLYTKPTTFLILLATVASAALTTSLLGHTIGNISSAVFDQLAMQPALVLAPVLLVIVAYRLNMHLLKDQMYPEERVERSKLKSTAHTTSYLQKLLGISGYLVHIELKLIWRHKRTRSLIIISTIFLLYALIFFQNEVYLEKPGFLIFIGIFLTGSYMFNYGQFMPGWQSKHFDRLLTIQITSYHFLEAKFWMFALSNIIAFILTLPYVVFSYDIIWVNLASLLFNIGVNSFIVFYLSVHNKGQIDLSRSTAFNWQGVTASKLIMQLPMMVVPLLLYLPFDLMGFPFWGVAVIGITGIVGIAFRKVLLQQAAYRLNAHRHTLAAAYRHG